MHSFPVIVYILSFSTNHSFIITSKKMLQGASFCHIVHVWIFMYKKISIFFSLVSTHELGNNVRRKKKILCTNFAKWVNNSYHWPTKSEMETKKIVYPLWTCFFLLTTILSINFIAFKKSKKNVIWV